MASYAYIFNLFELKETLQELIGQNTEFLKFVQKEYKTDEGKDLICHLLTFVDEKDSVDQVVNKIVEEFNKILEKYSLEDEDYSERLAKAIRSVLDKDNIEDKFEDFESYDDYEAYSEAKENNYDYSQYLRELQSSQIAKSICLAIDKNGNYVAIPTEQPISISENAANAINTLIQDVAKSMSSSIDRIKNMIKSKKLQIVTTDKVSNI